MKIKRIMLFLFATCAFAYSFSQTGSGSPALAAPVLSGISQEVSPPPAPPSPALPPLLEDLSRVIAQVGGGGYLGISVEEVTTDTVKELSLREERGVLIREVREDSAAANAGLKPKDVIVSFNGTRVEGLTQFSRMLRETPKGRNVTLGIIRDRREQEVRATLGSRSRDGHSIDREIHVEVPDIKIDSSKWPGIVWPLASRGRLGVQIQVLTEQLADYFGVPEKHGLLVTAVNADSPAAKAGIKAGDVIVAVEDRQIRDADDVTRALRDKQGEVKINIIRDRRSQTVRATLQPREAPHRVERRVVTRPRINVVRRPPMV